MKLVRLAIRQLPGIDPGFSVDSIDPGVNLVTGPNAIGKSSLVRALRYVVSPAASGDPLALSLEADFRNGEALTASRNGSARVWQRQGEVVDPPALPDRDSLHCYWLTMENLVHAGEDDQRLIEQLHQALAGGYDLKALRTGLFERKPRVGQIESKTLQDARAALRGVEADYADLQKREQRLPELEAEIEQARAAGARAEQLGRAIELLDLLRHQREQQAALAQFPANMDRLTGRELDELSKREQERERLQRERETAQHDRREAEDRLARIGLAEARPETRDLEAHRKRLEEAQYRQSQFEDKQVQRDQARADEDETRQQLGGERPPELSPEAVSRAETFAREFAHARQSRDEVRTRITEAEEAPEEDRLHRYRDAIQALAQWLAADTRGRRSVQVASLIALAGGVLATVVTALASNWPGLAGSLVATLAAAAAGLLSREHQRARARRAFEQQDLEAPANWNENVVRERLNALQKELDRMRLAHERALAASREREQLERLERELADQEQQKQNLAAELGFDPALTAAGIDRFVNLIRSYQDAMHKRRDLDQQLSSLDNSIREAREAVQGFLMQWGFDVDADNKSLEAVLEDLRARSQRAIEAEREMEQAGQTLERTRRELAERENEIAELYRSAGLEPGERRALEDSLNQLGDWQERRQQWRDLDVRIRSLRAALAQDEDLIRRAENGERETLEAERDRIREQADQYESLQQACSDLRAEIKTAGTDQRLEKQLAEVEQTRAALEDRLHEQSLAEAGQFLLDDVEAEHRSEHEPEVLADARERFQRFTHHGWDLELRDEALKARDLQQNEIRELTDLSSGTRMQLLLAIRLAWTRRLEKSHEPLPLFLDEALTTSDEQRFAAVADSLNALASEEGRQVFYLSARRHELGLWEQLTGKRPHHIDLSEIRLHSRDASATDYAIPEQVPLPVPAGQTVEEYAAALDIPPVDPGGDPGQLHLFHLMRDDLDWLHYLMEHWRLHRLGQLELFLDTDTGRRILPDAEERLRLWARCQTARAWFRAWNIGRGQPIDRGVLEDSGAVSETYIDRVTALAEQYSWDGRRLIEALENREIKGFREQKIQELREYLEANGHIASAEPLDREARERRTLMEAGEQADSEEIRKVVSWLEGTMDDRTEQQTLL